MLEYFAILAAIAIYLVLAWLVATAAEKRGRSLQLFALISVIFTPLVGFIALMIATSGRTSGRGDKLVRCPVCAEWIQPMAVKCRFCGSALSPAPPVAPQQPIYPAGYQQPGAAYPPQPPQAPTQYTVVPPGAALPAPAPPRPPLTAQPYGPRQAPSAPAPLPPPVRWPPAPAVAPPQTVAPPVVQRPPAPPPPPAPAMMQPPAPVMPRPQAPPAPAPQVPPPAAPPSPPAAARPPAPPAPPAQAPPPQQPGAYPTQPVAYPTQPVSYPTQPISYPTQPIAYPTQPVQYNTQPIPPPAPPPRPLTEAEEIAARIERMRHAPAAEHSPGFYDKVLQWLHHDDALVREEAVRFLARHCQSLSDAAPLLDMLTTDSSVEVRRASAECLGGLYRATRNRPVNEKLADVARNADEDEHVRAAAYAAIRRINGR